MRVEVGVGRRVSTGTHILSDGPRPGLCPFPERNLGQEPSLPPASVSSSVQWA